MRLPLLFLLALVNPTQAWAHDPRPRSESSTTQRARMTTEQRFHAANVTRDGRLTLEQARQGYKTVARNFETIDATDKGFVTLADIRAWRQSVRDAHQAARADLDDPLRPRPAVHGTPTEPDHPIFAAQVAGPDREPGAAAKLMPVSTNAATDIR